MQHEDAPQGIPAMGCEAISGAWYMRASHSVVSSGLSVLVVWRGGGKDRAVPGDPSHWRTSEDRLSGATQTGRSGALFRQGGVVLPSGASFTKVPVPPQPKKRVDLLGVVACQPYLMSHGTWTGIVMWIIRRVSLSPGRQGVCSLEACGICARRGRRVGEQFMLSPCDQGHNGLLVTVFSLTTELLI